MLTNHGNSESEREPEAAKVFRRKHPVNALSQQEFLMLKRPKVNGQNIWKPKTET
jgi:hypothetical protein